MKHQLFVQKFLDVGVNAVSASSVSFQLAHEFHILKRVNLEFGQFVVEAALADFNALGDVRLQGELHGWRPSNLAALPHFNEFTLSK